jgi:heme-degrading monooxygenase HmoA
MMVVVFRNRLRAGVEEEYGEHANRIYELALKMPGLVSSKDFTAEDGERLTVIEFRSAEELAAWRVQAEHLEAQERGRQHYYSEYSLQVCELVRESRFPR